MSENFRGGSLVDWRLALEPVQPALAERLLEGIDPYKAVEQLGLPTPLYVTFESIIPFLENPIDGLNPLTSKGVASFYVGLRSQDPSLTKYRELGLTRDEVTDYIKYQVREEDFDKYLLRIAEHSPAQYGATMIINPSGSIHVEIVKGEMASLATGAQAPDFKAWTDQFTGVMRYSFDDQLLREKVWQATASIPSIEENSMRSRRVPGYYEFSLIKRAGKIIPVFFDYKAESVFTVPEDE